MQKMFRETRTKAKDFISVDENGEEFNIKFTSKKDIGYVRDLLLLDAHYRLNKVGVACFTIDPLHQLMWSHYTDNHTGVCLIFSLFLDPDFFKPIDTISYQIELPKIKNPGNEKLFFNEIIDILFTKSKDWEYEKEYRVIKNIGTQTYKPEALSAIAFGYKMSPFEIKKIILLTKDKYPDLNFYLAKPSQTEYKIEFYDYYTKDKIDIVVAVDFETQTNKSGDYSFCVAKYGLDCICSRCKIR